ncbi:hypothetical protein DCO58_01755 [Helicobacter saguini]|uniref:Uncharacterized protein n=1 Tax=Helicobacter saguini TaxID=1548018 RepID=A0A347VRI0_9HELI|nr:hypothetical protein [Helicobacter saguini]MWV62893.1 hypothetical protein [Helicobacter saguini]MWV66437.1 hypothetical protein [Helicobacter saguini]MWV68787.1 hypothetical protein [Helicobacter saguini]MWV71658.1 hypothetical protein [Helicobacter saguini]TLD94460.1 hypothetical protein LS64_005910 [Helicobacter saguini]
MFDKYFNTLTLYILKKSPFERIVIFCVFALTIYVLCAILWSESQRERDISSIHFAGLDSNIELNKIATLAKKYDIKTKCLRLFCDDNEIDSKFKGWAKSADFRTGSIESSDTKIKSITKFMHFSCHSLKCFEFVREMESLPLVFIDEITGFNVLLLHVRDFESGADSIESSPRQLQDSKDEKHEILGFLFDNNEDLHDEKAEEKELEKLDSNALPIKWRQDIKLRFTIESVDEII